ncbi:MAG: response regulator [Cyanobacteria bacterium P01_G01_bin.38]
MSDTDDILEFAETLIHQKTDTYCSELQRRILVTALQGERKTYDQLAEECGYSAKYVKQDVAPKLWQLLSQALDQKVTKSNARATLEQEMRSSPLRQPVSAPAPAVVTPPVSAVSPPPEVKPLTSSNILLVDDQPKNLRLLSDLLEEQGYEVQQAINGAVALQAVTLDKPDLILLDIHMPEMDGYSVCQQLKADHATEDIPVIFVSALDEAWDKVKAFSAGGSDYITKPFKVVEVLARVENQLKIQQLQRELKAQNAQLQQAIQELQRLAALDDLTQVASRRRFDAYLLERWQQAIQTQTPLTLMLAQVDNFNFYGEGGNPTLGDQFLYQVAQAIKQTVQGPDDLVGRYGTLTFAIVLPQQETTKGEQIAQTLLKQVQTLKMNKTPATLSIGMMTTLPTPDMGLEGFLEGCDRNLQQAKSDGGNSLIRS